MSSRRKLSVRNASALDPTGAHESLDRPRDRLPQDPVLLLQMLDHILLVAGPRCSSIPSGLPAFER